MMIIYWLFLEEMAVRTAGSFDLSSPLLFSVAGAEHLSENTMLKGSTEVSPCMGSLSSPAVKEGLSESEGVLDINL